MDIVDRLRDGADDQGRGVVEEAIAEIERLRLDAVRYRWLRLNPAWESEMALMGMTPDQFDAAIDAAMKG